VSGDETWAVVPYKGRHGGKQRLAGLLDEHERRTLSAAMLGDVTAALTACPGVDRVVVVTPEAVDSDQIRDPRVSWLLEPRAPADTSADGLNGALVYMQQVALRDGARRLLIVPADLPTLTDGDVEAMLDAAGRDGAAIVIAPDQGETGTNALLLSPPDLLAPRFGVDSFRAHRIAAYERGVEPSIVHRPGLALDVDTPGDVARLLATAGNSRTQATLRSFRLEERIRDAVRPAG
jgi:2-phospho-L-lactate/phosphoenolpyruvate guanylyltransferase